MNQDFLINVFFDTESVIKTKSITRKIIYTKNPDEKKKNKLVEKLEKKAAEDSLKFNRRRLSSLFVPVFSGCISFSIEKHLDGEYIENIVKFGNVFFGLIEENFGLDIIDYSLIDLKSSAEKKYKDRNFFVFEIFNYNFDTHKAVKSEFVKNPNIKKITKIAEDVLTGGKHAANLKTAKKTVKPSEEESCVRKAPAAAETKTGKRITDALNAVSPEICQTEYAGQEKNMEEQVGLISLNWSLLSPSENIPVLEAGEPVEISGESMVRIYFQKPAVRKVVWRFRKKPKNESSKPILRVYKDLDMLWYETLDAPFGSRYIIFPEASELSQTWVEIGYLTENGKFIFIARSPEWPPACLLQKLPKLKMERNISKSTLLIGATESIPGGSRLPVNVNITNSGAGFSASGQDKIK